VTFSTRVTTTDETAIIHEVIATAGWGITHECVHVVQSLDPAAYLLASDESGRAIGVGFGLAFRQSAWIGHLVVRPEARGLGVGKALFDEILRHLVDSGKWPIYLVATEMGAPLYAKFGFVHDGGWTRWEFPHGAEPNLAAVAALGASSLGISVLPIEDGHLSRLVQFDTERFGDDRGQLLELSYRMYPQRSLVALRPDGDVAGCVVGGTLGLGPFVAEPEAAAPLLASLLRLPSSARPSRIHLTFPDSNTTATELCRAAGMVPTRTWLRMVLGEGCRPTDSTLFNASVAHG